jgi:hypothetical protein
LQRQAVPSIVIMLVGNKSDLAAQRKTPRELGEQLWRLHVSLVIPDMVKLAHLSNVVDYDSGIGVSEIDRSERFVS